MSRIDHLSFSAVNEFLMCPRKFTWNRIEDREPEFMPSALAFGISFHEGMEAFHKARMSGTRIGAGRMCGQVRRKWLELSRGDGPPIEGMDLQEAERLAGAMCNAYVEAWVGERMDLVPEDREVLAVEEFFKLNIGGDLPTILGRIDLLENVCGTTVLTDFKTSSRLPGNHDPDQIALYLRAVAEWDSVGYTPDLSEGRAQCRYVTLLKDDPSRLDVEKVFPEQDHLDTVIAQFKSVYRSIEAGYSYPETGWWCGGCQWHGQCDAYSGG